MDFNGEIQRDRFHAGKCHKTEHEFLISRKERKGIAGLRFQFRKNGSADDEGHAGRSSRMALRQLLFAFSPNPFRLKSAAGQEEIDVEVLACCAKDTSHDIGGCQPENRIMAPSLRQPRSCVNRKAAHDVGSTSAAGTSPHHRASRKTQRGKQIPR